MVVSKLKILLIFESVQLKCFYAGITDNMQIIEISGTMIMAINMVTIGSKKKTSLEENFKERERNNLFTKTKSGQNAQKEMFIMFTYNLYL